MKSKTISSLLITIFTIVLLLCIAMMGIWIQWYLTSSSYFIRITEVISPEFLIHERDITYFIIGIIILFLIMLGIFLIFYRLIRQTVKNNIYDDFLNTVSHELKTPLASIQLSLETIQQRKLSEEMRDKFYQIIAADTERLKDLIENIIEIALLEDDKKIFTPEVLTADRKVTEIVNRIVSNKLPDTLSINIKGDAPCLIYIDPKVLYIILENLLENSIKFCIKHPVVNIEYKIIKNRFTLYYSDNGIGIPKTKRREVFKKFIRIERPNLSNIKGTGLGLYYTKKIIKTFGGSIAVIDNRDNIGCTFRITLPVSDRKNA